MITLVAAVIFVILVVVIIIVATERATFHCSRLFVLRFFFFWCQGFYFLKQKVRRRKLEINLFTCAFIFEKTPERNK